MVSSGTVISCERNAKVEEKSSVRAERAYIIRNPSMSMHSRSLVAGGLTRCFEDMFRFQRGEFRIGEHE